MLQTKYYNKTHNGVHAGRHAPFFASAFIFVYSGCSVPKLLSVYAAGLISAVGTFVGSVVFPSVSGEVAAEFSGEAAGVEAASGVALGFAFSNDAFTASSSTSEVYLVSAEYVT